MSTNAILRAAILSSVALCLSVGTVATVQAQDVGGGIGGGAGIFRAKNPETKKSGTKPATTGTNVRIMGMNRAMITVMPPCFS